MDLSTVGTIGVGTLLNIAISYGALRARVTAVTKATAETSRALEKEREARLRAIEAERSSRVAALEAVAKRVSEHDTKIAVIERTSEIQYRALESTLAEIKSQVGALHRRLDKALDGKEE
jgi:uncharacterized protein YlxW (UPF0749 family)